MGKRLAERLARIVVQHTREHFLCERKCAGIATDVRNLSELRAAAASLRMGVRSMDSIVLTGMGAEQALISDRGKRLKNTSFPRRHTPPIYSVWKPFDRSILRPKP